MGFKGKIALITGVFALLALTPLAAKAPELEPRDVRLKLKEIMRSHARHHELDTVIVRRALENYVEILDPGKTYLTAEEIEPWIHPSDETLSQVLEGYRNASYPVFEEIHGQMLQAIDRRNSFEEDLKTRKLPKNVAKDEFRELDWAADPSALHERLIRLRAVQLDVAKKLKEESTETVLQRLEKRRLRQEERLFGVNQTERQRLMLAYILKATASALDSQTTYFTPEEAADFMIALQQRLFGIGVQLRDTLDGFTVVKVIDGGPADLEGSMKGDDRIVAVNGEYVVGMDILDVVQLIRGGAGSPIDLTLLREQENSEKLLEVTIVRDEVVLKETRIETTTEEVDGGVIGHIALHSFYQDAKFSSTSDIQAALDDLQSKHDVKGIILDLRYNSGGLLPQAINVTGLFIKKGIVASIKDNQGRVQHLRNTEPDIAWNGPLVVLVSRGSASASEIVAGTLQDYGRALIVGDPTTYGKGTFQTSTLDAVHGKHVNPKGEFKVTRGAYYTVSGQTPQLIGVKSDIVVPGPLSEFEIGEVHSRYPLEPDSIPPSFDDDLSDIPFIHRAQARRAYLFDLQPREDRYGTFIPLLQANSEERMGGNKEYQEFLSILRDKKSDVDRENEPDHQLIECTNIMKDLILSKQTSVPTRSAG